MLNKHGLFTFVKDKRDCTSCVLDLELSHLPPKSIVWALARPQMSRVLTCLSYPASL